ncbi:MAG TPA: ABC transporter permease [Patescibacteria group bacterium]|nr:ABC transporter permease [Patescibacteria group bacterium]
MPSLIIIRPIPKWYLVDFAEIWKFRELFGIFVWRDFKVRYKQTLVGIGWVVFQPLASTGIFTVFFGNFAKIPSQDLPYPVFVLLGLIFWGFFSTALSHASSSFIENDALVRKVYFPRELLPLSTVAIAFIDFLVSFVLFLPIMLIYRVMPNLLFFAMVLLGLVIAAVSSAGLGLLLASINIKYRDVRYITPFFLQLMIFVTPVIYPLSIVRPSFQFLLALNPMTGVIDSLRTSLAHATIVHPEALIISAISACVLFLVGMTVFRKTERFFADII